MWARRVAFDIPPSRKMSTEQFHYHYDVLPDALLLVSGVGVVLAASRSVWRRFSLPESALI